MERARGHAGASSGEPMAANGTNSGAAATTDTRFMQAALAYGRRNLGLTAPNPAVGAIVVRNGVIIGRGATHPGGRPHAETQALAYAGEGARGATLYVTLEPCSHHGHTAPCVDAIIAAGISRVVSALDDPDPRVSGTGHARLRAAGIAVTTGICRDEARRANLGHIRRMTLQRPMVTLKLAQTAEGYAAGGRHDPRLTITGEAANARVQVLRALHEAIMVGIGTAQGDDPLMTVRLPGLDRRPLRVVLDARLQLSPLSRLVATARAVPVLVIAGNNAPIAAEAALAARGVAVVRLALDGQGRIDLAAALQLLAARGITRVFSEGGPQVADALLAQDLVDEVLLFASQKPFGRPGLPALGAPARGLLADAGRFVQESHMVGADRLTYYQRVL